MKRIGLLLAVTALLAGYHLWNRYSTAPGGSSGEQSSGRIVVPVRNQLSAGLSHVVAISAAGDIYGWGANQDKQLGLPGMESAPVPQRLTSDIRWRQVHTGTNASYAITTDGDLWRRAFDRAQYVGDATRKLNRHIVYEPLRWDRQWSKVQENWSIALGLDTDGQLWLWDDHEILPEGRRDVGGKAEIALASIPSPSGRWLDFCVAIKRKFYAVASDGTLWESVELPHGRIAKLDPEELRLAQVPTTASLRRVSCESGSHLLALDAQQQLWGRGPNVFGELGDGDGDPFTHNQPAPQLKRVTDKRWADVAVGHHFTVAIALDGSLWAWGGNAHGQLGTGSTKYRDLPTLVDQERVWVAVTAHNDFSAALTQDGRIYAWGANRAGALGDGGASQVRTTPTRIHGEMRWAVGGEGAGGESL